MHEKIQVDGPVGERFGLLRLLFDPLGRKHRTAKRSQRTGVGSGSYSASLQLGSGAGVPEATESMCFLAGSLMFLICGTRRRGSNRRLS